MARLITINNKNIYHFFMRFKTAIRQYNIMPENIYNINKKGFSISILKGKKIIIAANNIQTFI